MKAPLPASEAARLEALRRYQVLDTAPEKSFDDIARLASFICGTPVSLITLLDETRQWFKAKVGVEISEMGLDNAFCAYAIQQEELMIVEDARLDERFASNPLVTAEPHVRFYAGAPLITPDGQALGSLCVLDREPRKMSDGQKSALAALGKLVINQLELRRVSAGLSDALARVHTLAGMLPICGWCKNVRDDQGYWQNVESFLKTRTEADLTHGICPDCAKKHFMKPLATTAEVPVPVNG
jgi:GAF domain-containing protein